MNHTSHIHNEYYDYDRYMGSFPAVAVLKEKKQRARLEHKCHCCGLTIPKGEEYIYFFVVDCDAVPPRAFASHQHVICPVPDDLVCPITGELR